MRVTKTVKEYIETKVREKLTPHYTEDKLESEYQKATLDKILKEATSKAYEAYDKYLDEVLPKFSWIEDCRSKRSGQDILDSWKSKPCLANERTISSVHCWQARCDAEAQEKAQEIIVALELGGNKEDLEKMLAEL